MRLLVPTLVLLGGCGKVTSTTTDGRYTFENGEGEACLSEYQLGSYQVDVDFLQNVPCWRRDAFECELTLDGDRLVVTASGDLDASTCAPGGTVVAATTRCLPIEVPDGAYVLVYGDHEAPVTLPLEPVQEVCLGDR